MYKSKVCLQEDTFSQSRVESKLDYNCWMRSINKACFFACCHHACLPNVVCYETCLPKLVWCCRQATGCTSGKGQFATPSTSRGCQVSTTGMLLLLLGQAKNPLLPLPQVPHPVEMVLPCVRLRPALSHRAVATGVLLLLAHMRPCPQTKELQQVSQYPVARPAG